MNPPRRVITGLDTKGRSHILFDGPAGMIAWSTRGWPADNSGAADAGGGTFKLPLTDATFMSVDFPPGYSAAMHVTDTVDYVTVVTGEVVFLTETGEVRLRAGDMLVNRGSMHGWRNDSGQPCRLVTVVLPAHPVGKGATLTGSFDTVG